MVLNNLSECGKMNMKIIKSQKFSKWYRSIDSTQRTLIDVRITRILIDSNFGNVKKICEINELKFKNGLRVYFGLDGKYIILLLNGGSKNTKKDQSRDIEQARSIFQEYLNDK